MAGFAAVGQFQTGHRERHGPSLLFIKAGAAPDTLFLKNQVMRDWKWSHAEKIVARQAFDQAFHREEQDLIREAQNRAARIEEISELWDLERWLTQRRRELERQYDDRYSVLPLVLATLLQQGRPRESDWHGLALEKIELIRHMASQRVT